MYKRKKNECIIDFNSKDTLIWRLEPEKLYETCQGKERMSIYNSLFEKYEYAGTFTMHFEKGEICNAKSCEIKHYHKEPVLEKINRGSNSSVKTTDGYCNFHTHPCDCYRGEPGKPDTRTVWGWPSGEDMREAIRFMMKDNLCHIVFTLEGSYCIQVNPNYLEILYNRNDELTSIFKNHNLPGSKSDIELVRGLIISLIESYFKATHGHRNIIYNIEEKENKGKEICKPQDWVKFANEFKLENLKSKKNTCSKGLPCNGIPNYELGEPETNSLREYLDSYGLDLYCMDNNGELFDASKSYKKSNGDFEEHCYVLIQQILPDLIKKFNGTSNVLSYDPGDKFKPGQWFKVKFFPNVFQVVPSQSEFISFDKWFSDMKKLSKNEGMPLSELIHSFWIDCCKQNENKQNKSEPIGFGFTPIEINFRPIHSSSGESCTLKHGNQISNWVTNKQKRSSMGKKPKSKKTKKSKLSKTNGKRRISAFGLNINKR